jgi:hypothetical protein
MKVDLTQVKDKIVIVAEYDDTITTQVVSEPKCYATFISQLNDQYEPDDGFNICPIIEKRYERDVQVKINIATLNNFFNKGQ